MRPASLYLVQARIADLHQKAQRDPPARSAPGMASARSGQHNPAGTIEPERMRTPAGPFGDPLGSTLARHPAQRYGRMRGWARVVKGLAGTNSGTSRPSQSNRDKKQ